MLSKLCQFPHHGDRSGHPEAGRLFFVLLSSIDASSSLAADFIRLCWVFLFNSQFSSSLKLVDLCAKLHIAIESAGEDSVVYRQFV